MRLNITHITENPIALVSTILAIVMNNDNTISMLISFYRLVGFSLLLELALLKEQACFGG